LKKILKTIPEREGEQTHERPQTLHPQEREFITLLRSELKKFNEFFMNREEEIVMKEGSFDALKAQNEARIASVSAAGGYDAECLTSDSVLCQKFANFHGELVLLEHWTNLNYAALVKILKKHDKRSNISLRSPFLMNVLQQPFYSTEVLTAMIGRAEDNFRSIEQRVRQHLGHQVPLTELGSPTMPQLRVSSDGSDLSDEGGDYSIEHTKAALNCWQDLDKSEAIQNPLGVARRA
jgi:SPX domain protein involved in polyphosphate accumulation